MSLSVAKNVRAEVWVAAIGTIVVATIAFVWASDLNRSDLTNLRERARAEAARTNELQKQADAAHALSQATADPLLIEAQRRAKGELMPGEVLIRP